MDWDIIILNMIFDTKHVINKLIHLHDMWMALWKKYGDPIVPPFLDDILSFVASVMVPPTLEEIPPLDTLVAPTDPIPAIDASDSVQQDHLCLLTLPSCEDFLLDIAQLFMESHIEDVGDIIDDIYLLFEMDTPSFSAVIDSCTSALQGTHSLPSDDFLPNIAALFLESHTVDMGDFYDDFLLLFSKESSTVVVRAHSNPQLHALHDQSF